MEVFTPPPGFELSAEGARFIDAIKRKASTWNVMALGDSVVLMVTTPEVVQAKQNFVSAIGMRPHQAVAAAGQLLEMAGARPELLAMLKEEMTRLEENDNAN